MHALTAGGIRGTRGRLLALVGVLALALGLLAAVPAAAQQDDGVTPARVGGDSRFHTAANLATLTFDQADVAHVVFADKFPDALAASYAAGVVDGPILLSPRDEVGADSPTMNALEQLGVQQVRLVGGPGVLSPAVAQELRAHGYQVTRIFGDDRYETSAQVATFYGQAPGQTVGTVEGQRTALMATGADFPDALAAGPIAAAANLPLVLTPPHRSDPATEQALTELGIERIHLIGGPRAVSEDVAQHYRNLGYTVERQAGPNRMATAALLADIAKHDFGFTHDLILLARGDDFPDALAASVHGAAHKAPILLTHTPHHLSHDTAQWLARTCPDISAIRALGGPGAVSPGALDAAVDVAEHCLDTGDPDPHTQQSYVQSPQELAVIDPGDTLELHVTGFQHSENPAPVNIALFPCGVTGHEQNTFQDTNGDGYVDGIGTSFNGHAVISSLEGNATSTTHLADVHPDEHHNITYTVHSDAGDCTIPMVFHDANDNNQLDVNDEGYPVEHWNSARVIWDAP